jgi:hypothetical protein
MTNTDRAARTKDEAQSTAVAATQVRLNSATADNWELCRPHRERVTHLALELASGTGWRRGDRPAGGREPPARPADSR